MVDRVVLIIGLRESLSSCESFEEEDSEGGREQSKVYKKRVRLD